MKNKDVRIEFWEKHFFVYSPYNRDFIQFAKNNNGHWDGLRWGWSLNEHNERTVTGVVGNIYGKYIIHNRKTDQTTEIKEEPIKVHFVSRFELLDI